MRDDRDDGPRPCILSKLVSLAVPAVAVLMIWGQTGKPARPDNPPPVTLRAAVADRIIASRYAPGPPTTRAGESLTVRNPGERD